MRPSLWHLLAVQPSICELRIFELLRGLRRDWDPQREADTIVQLLGNLKPWQMTTSLQEVELLVQQLHADDFRTRRWADRELRSRGRGVLCLLNELDTPKLDSEQRLRIKEIRRAVAGNESDTPQRVATWLANDKQVWLALMNHEELRYRQVAHAHLARIMAGPVAFQPDAESTVRSQQLTMLRTELALR